MNADGKLTNDRNVQIKVDGSYEFSNGAASGLNVGVSTRWFSGTPLNAYGYSIAYQNWEYYLVPRGSVGRGPADWEADVHVSYPIRFGGARRVNLIADVFNLFNRQAINQLDERYNLPSHGICGGIPEEICNGDGGIATTGDTLTRRAHSRIHGRRRRTRTTSGPALASPASAVCGSASGSYSDR